MIRIVCVIVPAAVCSLDVILGDAGEAKAAAAAASASSLSFGPSD